MSLEHTIHSKVLKKSLNSCVDRGRGMVGKAVSCRSTIRIVEHVKYEQSKYEDKKHCDEEKEDREATVAKPISCGSTISTLLWSAQCIA